MESMYDEVMAMSFRENDTNDIMDTDNFRNLQNALRRRGVVTNTYLQMNVHKYVQHVRSKEERERQMQLQMLQEEDIPDSRRRRNS